MSKHSQSRTMERYNLELTYSDENRIMKLLNDGKGIYLDLESQEPHRKFAYVLYKNIPIKVLFEEDENRKATAIITAYPFDADEYNEVIALEFKSRIDRAKAFLRKNNYVVFKKGSLKKGKLKR